MKNANKKKIMILTAVLLCLVVVFLFISIPLLGFSGYFNRIESKRIEYTTTLFSNFFDNSSYYIRNMSKGKQVNSTVYGIDKDGNEFDLFQVQQKNWTTDPILHIPRLFQNNNALFLYFNGRQYIDNGKVIENNRQLERMHNGYSAKVFTYSFTTNKVFEVALPSKYLCILDVFDHNGKTYFLAEKYNVYFNFGSSESSTLELYIVEGQECRRVTKLGSGLQGASLLTINGVVQDGQYYYPSSKGVHRIHLDTFATEQVLELELNNCENVFLKAVNQAFYVIAEKVEIEKDRQKSSIFVYSITPNFTIRNTFSYEDAALGWVFASKSSLLISLTPSSNMFVPVASEGYSLELESLILQRIGASSSGNWIWKNDTWCPLS